MKIRIESAECNYEREPLKGAFGFKGSALTCLWQTVVKLCTEKNVGLGLGVQSVLWSDSDVFHQFGEEQGNQLMFQLTGYAAKICQGKEFDSPLDLLDSIFPLVYDYAKGITCCESLRTTFVLNALVPVDFAAWQLWMKEKGKKDFDSICTFDGERQEKLANIPLITYNTPIQEIVEMAQKGTPLFKIKIGSDPLKNNDRDAMLAWDKHRIWEIHDALKDIITPYTQGGRILYYLDANGRYDTKDRLVSLLDYAEEQGIIDRIVLLEEPFDEQNKLYVGDLPVCVAADESAHSLADVQERYELGYRALTLKPIAKTLSMTIRMAEYARLKGMHCFCADLTVNPFMVSWNQCVAARLKRIPQMRIGVVESNGDQNYANWEQMRLYHPMNEAVFARCEKGIFRLDSSFYGFSAGILAESAHYAELLEKREG